MKGLNIYRITRHDNDSQYDIVAMTRNQLRWTNKDIDAINDRCQHVFGVPLSELIITRESGAILVR